MIDIAQEEIKNPLLTRDQIEFGLTRFRKLGLSTQRGKQTLIDSFVNVIFLFDDYAIVTCNYKDGEEKIAFEDIENSELGDYIKNKPEQKCSDLFAFGDPDEYPPKPRRGPLGGAALRSKSSRGTAAPPPLPA